MRNLLLTIIVGALCLGEIASAEQVGCSPNPGKTISRWATKTSIVNPVNDPIPVDLALLMGWDNPTVDKAMRKQLLVGRLARQPGAVVKEGDIVVVEGILQAAHCSDDDDDYHLEMSTSADSAECFIVEIPNGRYMKPPYRKQGDAARKVVRDLYGGTEPNGNALSPAVKVRVAGGLFYDSQHYSKKNPQGGGNRGTNHCATNLWEIHPVLSIARMTEREKYG
jgi:hypothetical protein